MATDYTTENLIAGDIRTDTLPLAADTYYRGMPLKYETTPTAAADGGNTGNGTVTVLTADESVLVGAWTLTFTAALVAKLTDPNDNVVATYIACADGAAIAVKIGGLAFTITDGSTAFAADDFFTITVAAGDYEYTEDLIRTSAVYNGATRTLSSAGYGIAIIGGDVFESGLVDDAGDALTITEDEIAGMKLNGLYVNRA